VQYDEAKQLFDAFSTDTRNPLEFVDTKAEEESEHTIMRWRDKASRRTVLVLFPVDILLIGEKTCATESH